MASPVDWLTDFVAYLSSTHAAGTSGTNLFRFAHPADFNPASLCTVVQPIPGQPGNKGLGIDFPSFQIIHRCQTPQTAWRESQRIYFALTNRDLGPIRLGASPPYTLIHSIQALQAPFLLGQDDSRAFEFSASYELDLVAE